MNENEKSATGRVQKPRYGLDPAHGEDVGYHSLVFVGHTKEDAERSALSWARKQAQKPEVPAGLLEELELFSKTWCNPFWKEEIDRLISRYRPVPVNDEGLRKELQEAILVLMKNPTRSMLHQTISAMLGAVLSRHPAPKDAGKGGR